MLYTSPPRRVGIGPATLKMSCFRPNSLDTVLGSGHFNVETIQKPGENGHRVSATSSNLRAG